MFPSYSSSLFPPLHSPKIQCHGQSPPPLPSPSQHDPFIRGGSKGAADFLLLGRWRRITLFTMCERLTEFSNRRPGLCRKALLPLIPSPELELEKANRIAAAVPHYASCSPPFCLMNYGFLSFSILPLMRARKERKVLEVTSRGRRRKKTFPNLSRLLSNTSGFTTTPFFREKASFVAEPCSAGDAADAKNVSRPLPSIHTASSR